MRNKTIKLILSLCLPFVAASIGGFFTSKSVNSWYIGLQKPVLNPPSKIFGPIWTILYLLMGISLFLIIKDGEIDKSKFLAIGIFIFQLILNVLWSYLFFGLQNPQLALILILFLWLAILLNIVLFWKINKISGILLIPYLLWVSFATYLNYQIYILNR